MTEIFRSERAWQHRADAHLPETPGVTLLAETMHLSGGAVVSVRGELDIASAPALQRRLRDLLSMSIERLRLDLSELEFIDSAGLHALDAVRRIAAERRVSFTLASLRPQVRRVFETTAFDQLFDITADDG